MILMEPKQINNNNSKKWIVLVSLFCFEQKKRDQNMKMSINVVVLNTHKRELSLILFFLSFLV